MQSDENPTQFYRCPACEEPHVRGEEPESCPLAQAVESLEGDLTIGDEPKPKPVTVRRGALLGDRYVIEELIGEGGMGAVYRARDIRIGRTLAVKTLYGEFSEESVAAKRFMREAKIMASLRHPGVADVWDFGIEGTSIGYLVMEYLKGQTLDDLLESEIQLTVEEACSLACQLLATLSVVHVSGVVHRDLKPANVFITQPDAGGGRIAKLLDFGLSQETRKSAVRLTNPGTLVGTPHYMSPELIRGTKPSPASDVYAVALMFYEMLGGELPIVFESDHIVKIFQAILNQPRRPIARLRDGLPPSVRAVVDRGVKGERAFSNAYEFLVAIDDTQDSAYRRSELARALPMSSAAIPIDPD